MCTRSGWRARMASTRGFFVPPTRGRSRFSGKIQKSVTATTSAPAPRSKRVSVSEGTSETTRRGGDGKRTGRVYLAALIGAVAVFQLWLAHRYFGFLTGDDVEILAEAF